MLGRLFRLWLKPTGTLRITPSELTAELMKFIQTTPKGKFGREDLFKNWFQNWLALPVQLQQTLTKCGCSLRVLWGKISPGEVSLEEGLTTYQRHTTNHVSPRTPPGRWNNDNGWMLVYFIFLNV